jgi:hypothetical protein
MKSISEFLDLLKNVKQTHPDKWMACCPAHNDGHGRGDQSLSIGLEGEKILLKCFAGCQTQDIVKTLGLTMSDLFIGEKPEKKSRPVVSRRRQVDVVYQYRGIGNELLFEVVRYKPKAFSQRRPDGQGGFINNLNGIERVIYRLPQIIAAIGRGATIFHVEGEKDAENLVKLGLEATTSPQGAAAWRSRMAAYYEGAKQVVIIPDKDEPGRAYAREVAADIGGKAGFVNILELPGDNIKDASDWIAAGGTAAQLEELVKKAPVYIPQSIPEDELDYDSLKKILKKNSDGQYTILNNAFHRIIHAHEETYELPLCNFVARITQDILKDSGANQERFLRLQGRLNGTRLPVITVRDEQFDNMNWVRREWGVKAQVESSIDKVERHLRGAIMKSSGRVPEKIIYTHTGWREIDGRMVYLTNSGAVGRPDIEVDLPSNLARYRLPQPDGDPKEAVEKSLEILMIADMKVTLPILILPYLSVLNVFEDINFTPWLIGRSGSLKSVMTALALSHFGDFTEKTLPANWFGTKTELEKLAFHAKDILFNIDDFAPPAGNAQKRELNNTAEYILRAYGNRQARVRSRADLTSQLTYIPRGLLVSSGEEMPAVGVSRSARTLPIPISKEDFIHEGKNDYYMLTKAQEDRKAYPVAMAHYIKWIQANWSAAGGKFREYIRKYRLEAPKNTDTHLRLIDAVAMMQAGHRVLLDFAVDVGALKDSTAIDMVEDGWDILKSLLDYQSTRISSERPGERFIEVLKSVLASGKAILRLSNDAGEWYPKESGPGQIIAGWDDLTETVYLNPAEAYSCVFSHCERMHEYFGNSRDATWQDLKALGFLSRVDEYSNKVTYPKRFSGILQRVLFVKREVLFGEE